MTASFKQGPHYQLRYYVLAVIRWEGMRIGMNNSTKISYAVNRYPGDQSEIQLDSSMTILRKEDFADDNAQAHWWRGEI